MAVVHSRRPRFSWHREAAVLRPSEPLADLRFGTGDDTIFQELNPLSLDRQKVKIADISKNGLGILGRNP